MHFLFGGNRIFNVLTAEEEELLLREDENGDVTPNHAGSEQHQQQQNARPAIRMSTEVCIKCIAVHVTIADLQYMYLFKTAVLILRTRLLRFFI